MSQKTLSKSIMISVGEASGDKHAAALLRKLKQQLPNLHVSGLGGNQLEAEGMLLFANTAQEGIIGILEIIPHLNIYYQRLQHFRQQLEQKKPDLLILVDFSTFNLRLAKTAKSLGIKTLYYISPQVWAWKQYRIKTIRETVDMMAVILPFEEKMYVERGVPAKYVGNPLLSCVKPTMTVSEAKQRFGIAENHIVVGLLPGSRRSEIKFNLPTMLASAQRLQQRYPNITFVLPVASNLSIDYIKQHIPAEAPKVILTENHTYDTVQLCDAAIVVSGTATLETALLEVPMVVIYKGKWLTYLILFIALRFRMGIVNTIALCNTLCGKLVVPELIQHQANPKKITHAISRYLDDPDHTQQVKQSFREMKASLANIQSSAELVDITLDLLRPMA